MAERSSRMDRSLDEIAAEMNSSSGEEMFGRYYDGRDVAGPSHSREHRSSHRYSPYPTSRGGPSWREDRERGRRSPGDEYQGARLFVANLSYSVSWQQLKDHMKQVGSVVKCDIFRNGDGSSKGMGLVVYADSEGAKRAVRELNDSELDGRRLFLREDRKPEERERAGMPGSSHPRAKPIPNPSTSVFVSNLEYSLTWQKIKDVFRVAGRIVHVEVPTDRDGKSRGSAIVQFEHPSEAVNAIMLFHGQMLHDRPMTVRMDSKSSFNPDPLQLKLGRSGLGGKGQLSPGLSSLGRHSGGSESGSSNPLAGLPLLAALGLSLTPEQLALLSNPALLKQAAETLTKSGLAQGGFKSSRDPPGHSSSSAFRPYSESSSRHSSRGGGPPVGSERQGGYRDRSRDFDDSYDRSPRHGYNYDPPLSSFHDERDRDYGYPPPRSPPPSRFLGPMSSSRGYDGFRGYREDSRYEGRRSPPPRSLGMGRRLFVRNLHYNTAWQRLKDHFRRAGSVAHVDVLKGPDGRSRGCAVVNFEDEDDAEKAIEMFHNSELDGRRIEVRFDRIN